MINRTTIAVLLLFISGCNFSSKDESPEWVSGIEKPNFLLILVEDISPYLSCYGDSTVKTPNIERLSKEGVRFTNVFTTSGVCAPSRSALITGMYPASIGTNNMRTLSIHENEYIKIDHYSVVLPHEVKCFTEYMRKNGYYCTNRGKRDWQFHKPLTAFDDYGLEGAHWNNREPGQAFFSIVNIFDTHESQIWMREGNEYSCNPENLNIPPYYPVCDTVENDIRRMYSNIVQMDEKVGSFINELEKDGLLDSTFIIFLSDHGGPLPRQKREITGAGLHVPMVIRFPGGAYAGEANNQLISFIDLAPTFLSLANIDIPDYMHGMAFLGNQKGSERKYIHGARDRMDTEYDRVRSVSDGEFFYIKNYHPELPWLQDIEYRENMGIMKCLNSRYANGTLDETCEKWFMQEKPPELLYNIKEDPWEIKNLADDSTYHDKLIELREAHINWLKKFGDKGEIPESDMVKSMWPYFAQPITKNPEIIFKNDKLILTCEDPGASIAYKVSDLEEPPDNTEPNGWELYSETLIISNQKYLHAIATRIGYADSDVITIDLKTLDMKTQKH